MTKAQMTRAERWNLDAIKAKCRVTPEGCWVCLGGVKFNDDHPQAHHDGKTFLIRRHIALELLGLAVGAKLVVTKCGTPRCLNPECLMLVTRSKHQANVHAERPRPRLVWSDRIRTGLVNGGWAKLNWDIVAEIRADHTSTHAELARRYGVCYQAIQQVRVGKTWVRPAPASIFNLGGIAA